jgi:6-hydroxycyclohex-1-ene-1-carbonyl-CoA dehydrogenase
MATMPEKIETWQMAEAGDPKTGKLGKLVRVTIDMPEIKPGEVLVQIAGCGVCHTDLGYFYDGVPTVQKPPLTLGHEISGTVVAGDKEWVGKEVIIPAVMPCRKCLLCKTGRANRCLVQKMPGNSMGIYGGNSNYIVVPSIDLCELKNRPKDIPVSHFSIVADAMTTPYQAAMRANLKPGDNVVVVGCTGGVGVHQTQVAKALGAKTVVGIARNPEKLKRALEYGADFTVSSLDKSARDVRDEFRKLCRDIGEPNYGWKIFEVTGTEGGQSIALELLSFIGKLIVVGFGTAVNSYSLSRLMAFDAEIIGTWGCPPEYYPIVVDMILKGKIALEPFVQTRPMSKIVETYEEAHGKGSPARRIVLEPDF